MTFNDSNEPDWDRLRAINAEVADLIDEGKWTQAEFDRLLAEAEEAVNGHEEYLAGFLRSAEKLPKS